VSQLGAKEARAQDRAAGMTPAQRGASTQVLRSCEEEKKMTGARAKRRAIIAAVFFAGLMLGAFLSEVRQEIAHHIHRSGDSAFIP